jgi:hypothetical protein
MAKTKFFRAFVEGATASDGRVIEGAWIDEIVANFNPATSPVRINCEHIKGFSPEPPFNAYGDVTAVRAQTDDIEIGGQTVKRRALYCQAEANDQLVAIRKAGQKPYPSLELSPNFAGTGKVGMVGMAITDNPASLGVEALQFSALKPMFDGRKHAPENFFTAAETVAIELETATGDQGGLVAAVTAAVANAFAKLTPGGTAPAAPAAPAPAPAPATPPAPANDNGTDYAALAQAIGTSISAAIQPIAQAQTAIQGEFAAMQAKLEATPAPGGFSRQPATGGTSQFLTDC